MNILTKYLFIYLLLILTGCHSNTPLIPKNNTNENERNNHLFVFVGEKITVEEMSREESNFDNGVKAKYKILQRVYGDYPNDVIEFKAYDHREIPPFTKSKNALLFVVESGGKYYQEKYQYFNVYKTTEGRWAGIYNYNNYDNDTTIKPEKIIFAEDVSFPIVKVQNVDYDNRFLYPEPYYKIEKNKATAIYGNYIEDLFRLKKEGILTIRGLFGNHSYEDVIDTDMAVMIRPLKDKKFNSLWKSILQSIKKFDTQSFEKILPDSIAVSEKNLSKAAFINTCYKQLFDSVFILNVSNSSRIKFYNAEDKLSNFPVFLQSHIIKNLNHYEFIEVEIEDRNSHTTATILYFVNTNEGYKLYYCYSYIKQLL
jgi:hypothetical protein